MNIDFTQPVSINEDGIGYSVTLVGGMPYGVYEADIVHPELWQSIQDWLAAGNVAEDYAPPAAVAILQSPAQLKAAQSAELESDQWAAIQQGLLALANGSGTDPLSVALQGFIKGVT